MSVARGSQNGGHYYSNIVMPQEVDLTFTVLSTNSLGVTSVKSNGWVNNVFMHTSVTPGTGNSGIVNPNPASGYCLVQLKQSFNVFLGMSWNFQPPTTGSALTSVTSGSPYVINSVGTTTAANWQTLGLPVGVTPAVGASFIAKTSASVTGSGTVKAPTTSGIFVVSVVGDPNASIANSDIGANGGGWVLLQLLNASGTATAPTDSSIVNLRLYYDRSSVTVDGL